MKVGILGGSFNPPHIGHLRLAIEALEQVGLDRVELVPAKEQPLKSGEGMLPFELRLELCRASVEGVKGLAVNDMEGRRPGPSYTVDTLEELARTRPEDEFYFILGSESFLTLPRWKRGIEIAERFNLIVANRGGTDLKVLADFIVENWPDAARGKAGTWHFLDGTAVRVIDVPRLDVSGTEIRRRVKLKRSIHLFVNDGVEDVVVNRISGNVFQERE